MATTLPKEVLNRLKGQVWDYRHDVNPEYWDGDPVRLSRDEFVRLPATDNRVVLAFASYQKFFQYRLDEISDAIHGRAAKIDGEPFAATAMLLSEERCSCPDFPDPNAATGSGSFPAGCPWSPYRPKIHHVRAAVKLDSMPDHWKPDWPWIQETTIDGYLNRGCLIEYVDWGAKEEGECEIYVYWTRNMPGRGTIGYAEFNNRTCNTMVFHRLNPSYQGSRFTRCKLHMHEFGHNNNCQHVSDPEDIMYPSINGRGQLNFDRGRTGRTLDNYYGGERPNIDRPDPPVDPPSGGLNVNIRGTINGRKYKLVPDGSRPPIEV